MARLPAPKPQPVVVVIPRFGAELKGGAEQQAWQIATRLAARQTAALQHEVPIQIPGRTGDDTDGLNIANYCLDSGIQFIKALIIAMSARIFAHLLFFSAFGFAASSASALELEWSAKIAISPDTLIVQQYELNPAVAEVTINNTGTRQWLSKQEQMFLSYHLFASDGTVVQWDTGRWTIPDLNPGEKATVQISLPRFNEKLPQIILLEPDLVREGRAWFSKAGSRSFPRLRITFKTVKLGSLAFRPEFRIANRLRTKSGVINDAIRRNHDHRSRHCSSCACVSGGSISPSRA